MKKSLKLGLAMATAVFVSAPLTVSAATLGIRTGLRSIGIRAGIRIGIRTTDIRAGIRSTTVDSTQKLYIK